MHLQSSLNDVNQALFARSLLYLSSLSKCTESYMINVTSFLFQKNCKNIFLILYKKCFLNNSMGREITLQWDIALKLLININITLFGSNRYHNVITYFCNINYFDFMAYYILIALVYWNYLKISWNLCTKCKHLYLPVFLRFTKL